jgi:glycosyltransferase involved in cell wall biosynthesis
VETVHESIPLDRVQAKRTRQEVLEELRVPSSATLVIGGGAINWRKGGDLFVQLARIVCRKRPNTYFVWVGGSHCDIVQLQHDVRSAELAEKVRLTGVVSNPADYFAAADVFALTSREDPYPIVCLEAAALGKPIVCFAGGGGIPEFVESDCGFIVPYLDVTTMAERVVSLLDASECRIQMGTAAQRKVERRHDIGVAGPRIMEIIERTILRG